MGACLLVGLLCSAFSFLTIEAAACHYRTKWGQPGQILAYALGIVSFTVWSFCLGIYDDGTRIVFALVAILLFIGAWGFLWRDTKPGLVLKLREHEEKTPEWQREEKREELERQQVQAQRIDFTRRGRYMACSLGWMALAFPLLIAGGMLISRDSYDSEDGAGLMVIFGGLLAMLSLAMLEGAGCRFRTAAPDNPCNDPCCKFTPARLLAYALYMASFALWVILCMVGIEEMDVGMDVGAVAAAFPVIIILIWGVLWCDVERSRRAGFTRTRDNKRANSSIGSAPSDPAAVVPIRPTTRAESNASEANDGAGAAGAASARLVAPVAVLAGV
jgi:amino acid transporter